MDQPIELDPPSNPKQSLEESTRELLSSPVSSQDSFDEEIGEPRSPKFVIDKEFAQILFVVWFGNFLTALDGTIVSTTMSNIASDFGQSNLVTWIATSYLLTSTAFQPLYGKTSDILGRKELLLLAQGVFCIGIFLSALATNVETLSIARAIAGMGGAGIFSLSSIIISDVVPLSQRSVFLGYGNIVNSASQMLGGPVGGICIVTIGWRWMFLIQVPFLLICMAILWFKVDIKVEHIPDGEQKYSRENLKRIDIGGIITLNLMVSSIIFLLSANENTSKTYKVTFSILLVLSSVSYIIVEKYVAVEKILDPEYMRGQIGILGVTSGISALALYMVLFTVPLYLQIVQGIDVTKIGLYTMFFVISISLGCLHAGYIIRKYDHSDSETIVAGVTTSFRFFVVQSVGFFVLLLVVFSTSPQSPNVLWRVVLISSLTVSGYGAGGFGVGIGIFVVGKAGRRGQASANTVVSLVKQLGNVLGVSVSLASYTKSLYSQLQGFFVDAGNAQYTEDLMKDSTFIRSGLPVEYIDQVLLFYRKSICEAFYIPLYLSLIGVVVMFLLARRVRQELWA